MNLPTEMYAWKVIRPGPMASGPLEWGCAGRICTSRKGICRFIGQE
ncbi:hypothetical protein HDA45_001340 [Amycolatopsis umgeniensis]|uniref:Uncharacterized protein n=1 Tax=Amycolatopsis umgeniensis TaxID=336628 RepID=A0A841AWH7_9PSEU|nr:hypothetical protein [Amycolatopsis umgeniensis]